MMLVIFNSNVPEECFKKDVVPSHNTSSFCSYSPIIIITMIIYLEYLLSECSSHRLQPATLALASTWVSKLCKMNFRERN